MVRVAGKERYLAYNCKASPRLPRPRSSDGARDFIRSFPSLALAQRPPPPPSKGTFGKKPQKEPSSDEDTHSEDEPLEFYRVPSVSSRVPAPPKAVERAQAPPPAPPSPLPTPSPLPVTAPAPSASPAPPLRLLLLLSLKGARCHFRVSLRFVSFVCFLPVPMYVHTC